MLIWDGVLVQEAVSQLEGHCPELVAFIRVLEKVHGSMVGMEHNMSRGAVEIPPGEDGFKRWRPDRVTEMTIKMVFVSDGDKLESSDPPPMGADW